MKAKKLSALLVTLCMAAMLLATPVTATIDPVLIFSPETNLTVSVDGEVSAALSDTVPYGEVVTLTAPAVPNKTFRYWTNGEGEIISYNAALSLTMYANTSVNAVYGASATAKTTAAFLNVTRTDGEIIFNAIANAPSGNTVSEAGIRYSTTKTTLNGLKGSDGVTVESAASAATNWTLPVTPSGESATYYAVVYAVSGGETYYSAVKAVKLAELQNGVAMVTNLGDIQLLGDMDISFGIVTFDPNGGEGVMPPQGVVKGEPTALNANTFTREGYTFNGWSTNQNGGGTTYTDGQSVRLSEDTTLYAQWRSNRSNHTSVWDTTTTTYAPTISKSANGAANVSTTAAKAGDRVTVTVKSDEGYVVDTVKVTTADGRTISVTRNADGTFSYIQPDSKVTIDVTYKAATDKPATDDSLSAYSDLVAEAWYADAVRWALDEGIMNGVGRGMFNPNGSTSRGMVATMLWRLEGSPTVSGELEFADVAEGAWFAEAVRWASANGIVTGYRDANGLGKIFNPNAAVNREQLATMLYRYAQYKGADVSASASLTIFPDASGVSSYAVSAMQWAVGSGIVNGIDGKLTPNGEATRAQVATMLMRYSTAK